MRNNEDENEDENENEDEDENNTMAKYHKFWPWLGKDYGKSRLFSKKILILGESNYGSDTSYSVTIRLIDRYLDPRVEREDWMNAFKLLEHSLVGHETTQEESQEIWNSLMYYNYLQVLLPSPEAEATDAQYRYSMEEFRLNLLRQDFPDVIIVLGKCLWQHMPLKQLYGWKKCSPLVVDGQEVENGYFIFFDETKKRLVCVDCPSTPDYPCDFWYKVISKFYDFRRLPS